MTGWTSHVVRWPGKQLYENNNLELEKKVNKHVLKFTLVLTFAAVFVLGALGAASAVSAAPPPTVLMHHFLGNGECQENVLPIQVADNIEWFLGPCPSSEVTEEPTEDPTEAPPETALMHHFLGNGECQENVLPIQVADNIEWFLGPCPDPEETEQPTEVVTEDPCEEGCETEVPPDATEIPGYGVFVIRVFGIDPNESYNWLVDGNLHLNESADADESGKTLTETWVAGSALREDGTTMYYTDLVLPDWPEDRDPCNIRIYQVGSASDVRPVTIQFRGFGIAVYGPHYEFSVVTCSLP